MIAALVLDSMLVNAATLSALSNYIVTEYPKLWSRLRFRIIEDAICFELRVNLKNNRYVREVLQPEVAPFIQVIPGNAFQ